MAKMQFDTEFDKEKYISLKGLVNNHNGEYKSSKQGYFFRKTWSRENMKTYNSVKFLDREIKDDEFVIIVTQHINFDPSKTGISKAYRAFSDIFILDDYGVKELHRVTHGYISRDDGGAKLPPRKSTLKFKREEVKYNNKID